jgi:molybdopterin-dependent oxidoreductase alpha subunit
MESALGFPQPREHGLDVVESIQAMLDGRVKVFFAMGGNFLSAAPDTNATAEALGRCRLTVHVATKPNRSHVTCGDHALLLPTLGRTERDIRGTGEQRVSVEDSMSAVHNSHGRLAPASDELRSEVAIVCELADRVLDGRVPVPWPRWADDYGLIRDAIEAAIPGFDDFNARLRDGFVLPSPPRDELRFTTPSGRAELTVNHFVPVAVPEGRLLLQTLRSHDQYNTTIYGLNDRYRGIKSGRRVVLLNPRDIDALGLAQGTVVDLISEDEHGTERRSARYRVVAYDTPRGCAAAYYPETNELVPLTSVADGSGTPTSKSVVIRVEPSGDN